MVPASGCLEDSGSGAASRLLTQEHMLHAAASATSGLSGFGLRRQNHDFGQCLAKSVGVGDQPVVVVLAAGPAHARLSPAQMRSRSVS